MAATARPPVPTAIRLADSPRRSCATASSCSVAAVIIVPVVYAVLGGFKDPAQLANDPVGLPNPWVTSNYTDALTSPSFWRQLANSTLVAVLSTVLVVLFAALAAFVFARRAFPGREVLYTLFTLGPAVPGGRRDPAPVHPRPRPGAARQPARDRPARGGLRPAADDRHPPPVLPEHPAGARGRRVDRRLRLIRVLLAHPPAALATRPRDGRGAGHRRLVEPVPAAAGDASDESNWTLPLGVTNFSTQYTTDTARILAYTTLALIPALVFYLFAERQLVGGLTQGSVKG